MVFAPADHNQKRILFKVSPSCKQNQKHESKPLFRLRAFDPDSHSSKSYEKSTELIQLERAIFDNKELKRQLDSIVIDIFGQEEVIQEKVAHQSVKDLDATISVGNVSKVKEPSLKVKGSFAHMRMS